MTATAILTADFRVALPAELAGSLGWTPGTRLALVPDGAGLRLVAVPAKETLAGIARGASPGGYRDRSGRADRGRISARASALADVSRRDTYTDDR